MMAYKNTQPEPLVERQPPSGSLYAQMLFCDGKLSLRCSQKLWLGDSTAMKIFGMFTDGEPTPTLRVQAKSKLFVAPLALRVSGRVRHNATTGSTKSTLYLKQRAQLGPQTAVNAKVELHALAKGLTAAGTDVQARVELSRKLFNITTTQDARLRVGIDLLSRTAYAEIRENHLTVSVSPGQWSVLYDI